MFNGKVIHEQSGFRIAWDMLAMFCIVLSLILIPYELAFTHITHLSTNYAVYLIDLILLIDIGLNFRTSFTRKGVEYADLSSIRKNYIRHYLPYDLLANIPFELLFLNSQFQIMNEPIVLVLRCLSFLRLVRLNLIFNRWMRFSRFKVGYMRIIKFFVTISLFIHVLSCAWYYTAYAAKFPEDSWVVRYEVDVSSAVDSYVHALYWTVTTMTTIGYGDITPDRLVEMIFVIIVMLLGASMYAYVIGNIASLVSNIDAVRSKYYGKVEMLNSFLISRGTPSHLIHELNGYHDYVWDRHGGHGADVLLEELPKPLHTKLMTHLAKDLLENVPLFRSGSSQLREELLASLGSITYPPGYPVIRENSFGDTVYFLSEGHIDIIRLSEDKNFGELHAGDYFGYMSVISGDRATVTLRTTTYCDLFTLSKADFDRLQRTYPEVSKLLQDVGKEDKDRDALWEKEEVII